MSCDIILLTCGNLPYLRTCVESIFKSTRIPCGLIIVDNASPQETKNYLSSLKSTRDIQVTILTNEKNLGFVPGMNWGMRQSRADYICLLNDDTVVTNGWLSKMISVAEAIPEIGILNPSSNNFGLCPRKDQSLDEFAKNLENQKGGFTETVACVGFCMLIKRQVVERIGYLDENLPPFFFDDTNYSMMANKAGFKCVIVKDAYVWHHEHKSFGRIAQRERVFAGSRKIFEQRWGRYLRIAWMVESRINCQEFRDILNKAVSLARGANFVYLFARNPSKLNREKIFNYLGLTEHAQVNLISYPNEKGFKLFCLWRVLKRRKKKYDIVLVGAKDLAVILRKLKFLHKCDIINSSIGFNELMQICKVKKFQFR
jgi:GT2 family glycosyltransferase